MQDTAAGACLAGRGSEREHQIDFAPDVRYTLISNYHNCAQMPSHYKGKPDEILALDTLIKLSRSVNAVQGSLLPSLQRDYGITEGQLSVLEALYHLGPLSQGQLCKKVLRSGSNMTTVVDNLERDRLVKRTQSEDDRRVHIVSITERGRALMIQLLPEHVSRISGIMSALTKDEQRELGRLCRKLGTSVAR